jgi:6-phosphogluconate dehydrogenase
MKSDSSNAAPQIILVGLGKMGGNMARRLARGGVQVLGVDPQLDANDALAREPGVTLKASLAEAIAAAPRPRSVWLMLPAGVITESTLAQLETMLGAGDLVVDGGNANYLDSQRRGARFAGLGIEFADCGVSGGVWGLANGYCLMYGASPEAAQRLQPFVLALAPGPQQGWVHAGAVGAGHFAKMIHNGIEYAMMQAYAEGFALLNNKADLPINVPEVAQAWQQGSVVRSWLLDLTVDALRDRAALDAIEPFVADSGEGRWTIDESIRQGTPAPVIALAVMSRFTSQGRADFGNRLLALMRKGFGGHAVKAR